MAAALGSKVVVSVGRKKLRVNGEDVSFTGSFTIDLTSNERKCAVLF
jgi:hypothetical protein